MKFGVALVSGYLLGSISFAYLIVYALTGEDVRKLGDGNPGAANVARTLGRKWGVLVWSGDVTKTLVALTFARRLGVEHPVFLTLVGIAAILGHCYSIFLKFRGGKGVACMGAVILFIMPRLFPLAIFLWFLIQKLNPRSITVIVQGLVIFLLSMLLLYPREQFFSLAGCVLLLVITALSINYQVLKEMRM